MWLMQRLALSLFLVWSVASILFMAIRLVPGDPAEALLYISGATPDPAAVAVLRERLGLNEPLLSQYLQTFIGYLHGDLGRSLQDDASIGAQIALRLPRTLELVVAAGLISALVGLPAGVFAALRRGGVFDRIASAMTALSMSLPVFVVGTVLMLLLSQTLRLLPAGGFVEFSANPLQHLKLMIMPALTLSLGLAASVFRITRGSTLETLQRDYVRTAHAKGLAYRVVLVRHVLRNALMPVITVIALNLGAMLGGSVLVESIFSWPGLAGFTVSAVSSRDYPAVVASVLVISAMLIGLNLLVDIVYAKLDPRTVR